MAHGTPTRIGCAGPKQTEVATHSLGALFSCLLLYAQSCKQKATREAGRISGSSEFAIYPLSATGRGSLGKPCFPPSWPGVGRVRGNRKSPVYLVRCAPVSPSAFQGGFSQDSPGPPRLGVSTFGHRTSQPLPYPGPSCAGKSRPAPPKAGASKLSEGTTRAGLVT